MGKGLAVAGFLFSIIFVLTFIFNLYSLAWIGLAATIIGFVINIFVLIKRLEGKKFAILGIIFNVFFVLLFYVMPIYFG
jgi:nicotinamide riboside transporter PnuC